MAPLYALWKYRKLIKTASICVCWICFVCLAAFCVFLGQQEDSVCGMAYKIGLHYTYCIKCCYLIGHGLQHFSFLSILCVCFPFYFHFYIRNNVCFVYVFLWTASVQTLTLHSIRVSHFLTYFHWKRSVSNFPLVCIAHKTHASMRLGFYFSLKKWRRKKNYHTSSSACNSRKYGRRMMENFAFLALVFILLVRITHTHKYYSIGCRVEIIQVYYLMSIIPAYFHKMVWWNWCWWSERERFDIECYAVGNRRELEPKKSILIGWYGWGGEWSREIKKKSSIKGSSWSNDIILYTERLWNSLKSTFKVSSNSLSSK